MNISGNTNVIGQCSLCGGTVFETLIPYSVSIPKCDSCGAQKKNQLPIVEMENPIPKPQLLNE